MNGARESCVVCQHCDSPDSSLKSATSLPNIVQIIHLGHKKTEGGGIEAGVSKPDYSPTHFRDLGISEDPFKKKQEKSEPILLKTNENIRYGIYKAFTNFQIIEKIPKINKFFFDEKR